VILVGKIEISGSRGCPEEEPIIEVFAGLPPDTRLVVGQDYLSSFGQFDLRRWSVQLGDFLKGQPADPEAQICTEMPIPREFAQGIQIDGGRGPFQSEMVYGLLHVGRQGAMAPLHFDWDFSTIVHVCLEGEKTFYLVPPEAGWLLNPVINTSAFPLPRLYEEDKENLLKITKGEACHLKAGEAVAFPSIWWHAAFYDQASTSVSIRFSGNPELRPLAVLPRSWVLQRLVWELSRDSEGEDQLSVVRQCLEKFFQDYPSPRIRYSVMKDLYRGLLKELGVKSGLPDNRPEVFDVDLAIGGAEIDENYTWPSPQPIPAGLNIDREEHFLFNRAIEDFDAALRNKTATFAVQTLQGLEPKRGLIKNVHPN